MADVRRAAALAVAAFGLVVGFAAPAQAAGEMEITSFDAGLTNYQAGGHPDAFLSFRFATAPAVQPVPSCPDLDNPMGPPVVCHTVKGGVPKDVVVDLPKGLLGDPSGIAQCTTAELNEDDCPAPAQVGVQNLYFVEVGAVDGSHVVPDGLVPVFNMVPERGEVAKFGFRVAGAANTFVSLKVRPGDYGVTASASNIFTGLPLRGADMVIWGDPYDPEHDPDRYCHGGFGCSSGMTTRRPFMVAPAECGVDAVTGLRVRSWLRSGDDDWTSATSTPRQVHGCDRLAFRPLFDLAPTTGAPDAPTGLDARLSFAQNFHSVDSLETPPLRDAVVTLPEGLSINPSSADGLAACGDAQLRLGSSEPVACPDASKIGTAEATTPVLEETLTGSIYVRPQNSDDPESGELFRVALVLENAERGLSIRLPGAIRANRDTGRIEASFMNNPQLPVSTIDLRFKSGPRAPLATPQSCGEKTTLARLTSWAGDDLIQSSGFHVDCAPGLGAFDPSLTAGTVDPVAGGHSPFVLRFSRADGQQSLRDLSVDLPEGLVAKIANVAELCADGPASAGACGEGSRIGSAMSGTGAGSNPLHLPGRAYLTEGYKGAPYGMSIVVPAVAGPFDLGNVVVRAAVHVDRDDASVRVVSDPLPQIVKGVPLRLRSVEVKIDKPGFMINPTSCQQKRIDARFGSAAGAAADRSTRFQVGDCQALPFTPKLSLAVTGKRQRTTGKHPGVKAVVRQRGIGEAGIDRAKVTLPKSLALDPDNAQALCEFEDGTKPDLENHCPKGSVVGRARAVTPLLDKPLAGDVYFVKNVRRDRRTGNALRTLPMIVVALRGEIAINLTGKSSTTRSGRLVNTFASVPDAPITKFNLNIKGGKTGILAVTRTRRAKIDLCDKPKSHIANNRMDGHNGKRADSRIRVKTACATNKPKKMRGK